jgi:hypothetical protein
MSKAQSLSVKQAEVEFHKFASFGEPERVLRTYAEENHRRRGLIRKHRRYIGAFTPFLEIGANAGHTSYMVANEFGAEGFALDLSADALRYGEELRRRWMYPRSPVRIAATPCPAVPRRLHPLRHGSPDVEPVHGHLQRLSGGETGAGSGGVFFFFEEPLRRVLTLRLFRCPYREQMKPWNAA